MLSCYWILYSHSGIILIPLFLFDLMSKYVVKFFTRGPYWFPLKDSMNDLIFFLLYPLAEFISITICIKAFDISF